MPYRYLDDIATADVAFEATGETLEELFIAAAAATLHVMIENPQAVEGREIRVLEVADASLDMLLFQFLQELIYYKDAQQLLLRVSQVQIERSEGGFRLRAAAGGEEIDPGRHEMIVDVKAVTLHRLSVEQKAGVWTAVVVLDI
jgi:SHS2 domain-containing protein